MRDPKGEGERWLRAAAEELAVARHSATGDFHAAACSHAQQAAEKAVKAVHYGRDARTVIGHNVRALVESLDPREPSLDALLDAARELDLLYVPTRYPNGLDAGTPAEAFSEAQSTRAIAAAESFLAAVCGLPASD